MANSRMLAHPWNFYPTEFQHDFPVMTNPWCCWDQARIPARLRLAGGRFGQATFNNCACINGILASLPWNPATKRHEGSFAACGHPDNFFWLKCVEPGAGIFGYQAGIRCGQNPEVGNLFLTDRSQCDIFSMLVEFAGATPWGDCCTLLFPDELHIIDPADVNNWACNPAAGVDPSTIVPYLSYTDPTPCADLMGLHLPLVWDPTLFAHSATFTACDRQVTVRLFSDIAYSGTTREFRLAFQVAGQSNWIESTQYPPPEVTVQSCSPLQLSLNPLWDFATVFPCCTFNQNSTFLITQ